MSYTLKIQQIAVKDPDTGTYSGVDVLTEQTKSGLLAEIQAEGTAQRTSVTNAGTAQVSAVQAKGAETLASIPSDYTTLSNDVDDLKNTLNIHSKIDYSFTLGKATDATGAISNNNYMCITQRINCEGGDIVVRRVPNEDSVPKHLAVYVSEYTGETFVKRTEILAVNGKITVGNTTDNIIISFGRYSSSGITISQSDIDNYFAMEVYRTSTAKSDFDYYHENTGFENRGNVIDLGYSAFSDCTKPGHYTFSAANLANINDAPHGLADGGLLIVYIAGNAIWQEIHSTHYEYIRYGAAGVWIIKKDLIRVAYDSSSGSDSSTESINIFVPRSTRGKTVRYSMGHCIDNSINSNVWRLMYVYDCKYHQVIGTVMNRRGEFECAIKLQGRPDFSGGYVHGDEIDQQVTFLCDGVVKTAANTSGFYNEFRVVRNSILYDPVDNTTPIAEHGVEYIYTVNGLEINQSVKWLVDASLAGCYLAMLPILKTFSTYRYDDTNFKKVENTQSNYSVTIPNAKSVTEYIDGISTTMEIDEYPTGLTGGDCALVTDNNGESYNKVYFVICTGGTVANGTLWKSKTKYLFK